MLVCYFSQTLWFSWRYANTLGKIRPNVLDSEQKPKVFDFAFVAGEYWELQYVKKYFTRVFLISFVKPFPETKSYFFLKKKLL